MDTQPHVIHVNTPKVRGGGTAGMRTARRNEFTPEDDRLLLEYIKSQVAVNKSLSGTVIYNAFAEAVRS